MGLWDFTGIGIIPALLFTPVVFILVALVAFMVSVIPENDDSGRLRRQNAPY
jgi:hypothetical protein